MIPTRRSVLCIIDSDGKIHPVASVEVAGEKLPKFGIGYSTTIPVQLIQIGTKYVESLDWGQYLRNIDVPFSNLRDGMNVAKIGGVAQTGADWTPHIQHISNLATEATLSEMHKHRDIESGRRCHDVSIETNAKFIVPSDEAWYVSSLTVQQNGRLFLEGDIVIVN